MKRDASIEGMRIIACFLVIMAHIQLDPVLDGIVMDGRLLFSTVIADNVPVFFLIMGFYLFREIRHDEDISGVYIKKIKNLFFRIWIPSVFIVALSCFLFPYFSGQCGLRECLTIQYDRQWNWLWDFIFRLKAEGTSEHLWYICTYVKIIVWFPILALLCQNIKQRTRIRHFFICISLLYVLFNDAEYVLNRDFCDFSSITFDYYFLYVLLGYELSFFFEKYALQMKKIRVCGLIGYIGGVVLKYVLQQMMYRHYGTDITVRYMWLQCLPCYITSCSLFCFLHSFKDVIHSKVICVLGRYTFYIYLVHRMIIYGTYNLKQDILAWNGNAQNLIHALLYYLEYGMVIFLIGLVIAIFFDVVYLGLRKTFRLLSERFCTAR